MKPHRVVEARGLQRAGVERQAVRKQRGVEQRHVGRIGEHALMQRDSSGSGPDRAKPQRLVRRMLALGEAVDGIDRPEFDRPRAQEPGPDVFGHVAQDSLRHSRSLFSLSGSGTSGIDD